MYKTFSITEYYKGVELRLICVTTSKRKFADITDKSLSYINNYANSFDLRYQICNDNPDKLYALPGLGGEALYIFNKDEVKTFQEYKKLIDAHRKKFKTYYDYSKFQNQSNE
jgi:hypothetical protein